MTKHSLQNAHYKYTKKKLPTKKYRTAPETSCKGTDNCSDLNAKLPQPPFTCVSIPIFTSNALPVLPARVPPSQTGIPMQCIAYFKRTTQKTRSQNQINKFYFIHIQHFKNTFPKRDTAVRHRQRRSFPACFRVVLRSFSAIKAKNEWRTSGKRANK